MNINILDINQIKSNSNRIWLGKKGNGIEHLHLQEQELRYVRQKIEENEKQITINQYSNWVYIQLIEEEKNENQTLENIRKAGSNLLSILNSNKTVEIDIIESQLSMDELKAFLEGLVLSNYQFTKYFKHQDEKTDKLKIINIFTEKLTQAQLKEFQHVWNSINFVRDLINEPVNNLNAVQLSAEFYKAGAEAGISVEIFDKHKIESLGMGGLLAVNKGSVDPPTFTIMEWKPENVKNEKPYILVGKGIVYDTGGLSLKPTHKSMDTMKCDMAGAAIAAGIILSIAKNKLPLHIIALIPATDNRPSGNAYAPGDIIKMYDGTFVEVLNCDAEGRLTLADALSFAKQYNPELVIDIATLTGAAARAVGSQAMVAMGTASDEIFQKLRKCGYKTHERIVEFPLWDEYKEQIKSDIADLKNIGGDEAGAITAGKFLEVFTSYPWIHLDIAGNSFFNSNDYYRVKGGTGIGIRLLYEFLKSMNE
jgi:leucyl aminopeptidase